MRMIRCLYCGETSTTRMKTKKFCDATCSNKYWYALTSNKPTYKRSCVYCKKEFETKKGNQVFCCGGHRKKHHLGRKILLGEVPKRWIVLNRDNFRCYYCGRSPKDGIVLHVDHIVPKSKGGSDDESNLRTACADCNVGKGNKYYGEKFTID